MLPLRKVDPGSCHASETGIFALGESTHKAGFPYKQSLIQDWSWLCETAFLVNCGMVVWRPRHNSEVLCPVSTESALPINLDWRQGWTPQPKFWHAPLSTTTAIGWALSRFFIPETRNRLPIFGLGVTSTTCSCRPRMGCHTRSVEHAGGIWFIGKRLFKTWDRKIEFLKIMIIKWIFTRWFFLSEHMPYLPPHSNISWNSKEPWSL